MFKKCLLTGVLVLHALCAGAQTFTPALGFSATELFTINATSYPFGLSALGVDSNHVYYIETNDFGEGNETRLLSRALSGGAASTLFDYNLVTSGGFVKVNGGTVWFADTIDTASYSFRKYNLTLENTTTIGTIPYAYDIAFDHNGAGYVSHSPGGLSSVNFVSQVSLADASLDSVLNCGTDASGPLAFDTSGNLYYGSTSFGGDGNLRSFTAAQVALTSGSNADLTLSSGTLLYDLASNQYLAFASGLGLFQSYSPFGSLPSVTLFQPNGSGSTSVGSGGSGTFVSGLAWNGNSLIVALTDSSSNTAKIYQVSPVPEPSSLVLGLFVAGIVVLARRRPI